jgi:phosphopantothenoylcysteine decarboxylase / phosphopantothenate---cysteine ligase
VVSGKRILLIISGGIAAYKCLELIRRLRDRDVQLHCVLTSGGAQFVTPLSVAALSEGKVYSDLFSLTDESEMGHIQLSRDADLLVVAPASADIIARMSAGIADDLATTVLLATDKPVLIAPAMNVRMWEHAATQANIHTLETRGIIRVGPESGDMACGEFGFGRMAEVPDIVAAIERHLSSGVAVVGGPLAGRSALVTSGPTREPIDPVRFIANRSSGKQGHAIATALSRLGAQTTLVSGPTTLADPTDLTVIHVETAREMLAACETALPVDIAVCAAAVADWRVSDTAANKLKKNDGVAKLDLTENPDILHTLAQSGNKRPELLIGFAAETEDLVTRATEKRLNKGCDWIIANDVSADAGTFEGDDNTVHWIDGKEVEAWPKMSKDDVAMSLATRIAEHFAGAS